MRIYLDVCCLNRPFDDQTQDRIHLESEAVLTILNCCQSREWQLVGSEVVDFEISKIPDEDRKLSQKALKRKNVINVRVANPLKWVTEVMGNGE